MEQTFKRILVYDPNTEPPKNYLWMRDDGNIYEFDRILRSWVLFDYRTNSGSIGIQSGTTDYWNSQKNYIPEDNMIIVYTDYKTIEKDGKIIKVPGIKIGSGAYVQDLPFIGENVEIELDDHIKNLDIHVTKEDKENWNHKFSIDDSKINSEVLIFKQI